MPAPFDRPALLGPLVVMGCDALDVGVRAHQLVAWAQVTPHGGLLRLDDESHAQDLEETIATLNYVKRYLWDRLPACVNIPF